MHDAVMQRMIDYSNNNISASHSCLLLDSSPLGKKRRVSRRRRRSVRKRDARRRSVRKEKQNDVQYNKARDECKAGRFPSRIDSHPPALSSFSFASPLVFLFWNLLESSNGTTTNKAHSQYFSLFVCPPQFVLSKPTGELSKKIGASSSSSSSSFRLVRACSRFFRHTSRRTDSLYTKRTSERAGMYSIQSLSCTTEWITWIKSGELLALILAFATLEHLFYQILFCCCRFFACRTLLCCRTVEWILRIERFTFPFTPNSFSDGCTSFHAANCTSSTEVIF